MFFLISCIHIIFVAVELPEKQGLKQLGKKYNNYIIIDVAVELPEKQGLKRSYTSD